MENTKTKIILKGTAPEANQETSTYITGSIDAVSRYFSSDSRVNISRYDPTHSVIGIEYASIKFHGNMNMKYNMQILGVIKPNALIKDIGINADRMYLPKELEKKLRFLRYLFTSDAEYAAVINKLKDINIKTSGNIQQTATTNKQKVLHEREHDFEPIKFIMQIPLFEGDLRTYKFEVSIYADVIDTGAKLWLEAIELQTLYEIEKGKIIADEVEKLKPLGFPMIYGYK